MGVPCHEPTTTLLGVTVGAPTVPTQRLPIVDDDPILRESLSRMLSKAFEVETASGVGDARRGVSSAHFDAILYDVMMDEGGGEAWLTVERAGDELSIGPAV